MNDASKLHRFDVLLNDNVTLNVRAGLRGVGTEADEFRAWVTNQLGKGPLLDYLSSEDRGLLFNEEELRDLEGAIGFGPYRLWWPLPAVYARYVGCLPEIRANLAGVVAEAFATSSETFINALTKDRLGLESGLEFASAWIRLIRQMKRDSQMIWALARPEGDAPTPSTPLLSRSRRDGVITPKGIIVGRHGGRRVGRSGPCELVMAAECELTPKQAAILLNISERQIYRLIEAGRIPAVNVGVGKSKSWRLRQTDVETFRSTPSNIHAKVPHSLRDLPPYVRGDLLGD